MIQARSAVFITSDTTARRSFEARSQLKFVCGHTAPVPTKVDSIKVSAISLFASLRRRTVVHAFPCNFRSFAFSMRGVPEPFPQTIHSYPPRRKAGDLFTRPPHYLCGSLGG